jgi:FkbM family methyltransferase
MKNITKRIMLRLKQGLRFFYINLKVSLGKRKIKISDLDFSIQIRPQSSDVLVFHQIFTFKIYDINIGFTPKFIVDAGANIGFSSVFFSKKFPKCKIVSIEPEKSNFQFLRKNTAKYPNIIIEKKALSNQINLVYNVVDKGLDNWGFVTEIKKHTSLSEIVDTVETITIDAIFQQYDLEYLDLLKIDIEGGEKELFESNYENWLPKTKCINIELHDGVIKGSSKSFFSAICKYDFSYYNRGENLLFINNRI